MWRLLSALAVAGLLAGCAMPYRPVAVVGDPGAIVGVREILAKADVQEVDVFLVHGMCTRDREWVARANNALLKTLGSNQTLDSEKLNDPTIIDGETEVYQQRQQFGDKTVVTHAILWSPTTIPGKKTLCYDRDDPRNVVESAYCSGEPMSTYERAIINRSLKNGLMNDCLADVLVYVGPKKVRIREQMRHAIGLAAGHRSSSRSPEALRSRAASETVPLFVITASLGSKIFFDTLLLMSCDSRSVAVAERTFTRTAQIFMGANQIPILTLAAPLAGSPACLPAAAARETAEDPLNGLAELFGASQNQFMRRLRADRQGQSDRFEVVVFTDPNDLLSYPLHNSRQEKAAKYSTVDVIVSNDYTWLGALENPVTAHTDYLENPDVQRVIACGLPLVTGC